MDAHYFFFLTRWTHYFGQRCGGHREWPCKSRIAGSEKINYSTKVQSPCYDECAASSPFRKVVQKLNLPLFEFHVTNYDMFVLLNSNC